jgi:hypothetical protein
MYHGKMGFTHTELYNLPIYLRSFYYKKLVEVRKQENEEHEKAMSKSKRK